MRSYWAGFLGGLMALALVATLIGGALVVRAKQERAAQRTTLLRQIDEYEAWFLSIPVQSVFANTTSPTAMLTLRDHFTAQRHPLQEYIAWWQADFARRNGTIGGVNSFRLETVLPQDLRDPAAIERFIATR